MGFAEDVEQILADTPDDKQVALFSATMPGADPPAGAAVPARPAKRSSVKSKTTTAANITQRYLVVSYAQKIDALTRILEVENFDGMIVFVRTKNETETLAEKLRARGYSAAAINGDIAQAQRERTIGQLKDGKLDILVATDVAARGLDVERISHVVNFDIPTDTESYVHRIGRTGRAGRSRATRSAVVTPRERHLLKHIERATRQQLDADAAADHRRRQQHPAGAFRRRDHRRAGRRPRASRPSATSSPTTCATTTCRRPMWPRRWRSSPRARRRCCSILPTIRWPGRAGRDRKQRDDRDDDRSRGRGSRRPLARPSFAR